MADTRKNHHTSKENAESAARKKARQARIAQHKREIAQKRVQRDAKKREKQALSLQKKQEKQAKNAVKFETAQRAIKVLEKAKAQFKKDGQSTSELDSKIAAIGEKNVKYTPNIDTKKLATTKRLEKQEKLKAAIAILEKAKTKESAAAANKLKEKIQNVKAAPKRDQTQESWYKAKHTGAGTKTGRN